MASRIRSQQENRIPLGKKRKTLEKTGVLKKNEEVVIQETNQKKNTSHIKKKLNKRDEFNPLKIINLNVAPTDTSLTLPTKIPRSKLSTVKEIEENTVKKSSAKTKSNTVNILKYDPSTVNDENKDHLNESTVQVNPVNSQENIIVEDINNTINEMKIQPELPEIKLNSFVCTTRGQKWKPSPRKPPKLSELFIKYDDNNIADTYRKKLDVKTSELQSKIKYWVEFSSENCDIPQSIKDEIDVVCGQTKLLTTDKFMQMRSLIEEYDNKSGSMPITTDDLDGFWDMILLQVDKLESQFSQLVILKENNWAPLQPIAKNVINKISKIKKRPEVKSRIANFLKSQNLNGKKGTNNSDINDSNHPKFNELVSNNLRLISSTPTSNEKTITFTPVLLKTLELSHVARRSGMTPIIVTQPHASLLKPALKNTNQEKDKKHKSIKFDKSTIVTGFITPENSYNGNHKSIQDRVATPYIKKDIESKANPSSPTNTKKTLQKNKPIKSKTNNMTVAVEKSTKPPQLNEHSTSIRRSSRLASKPSKNYKV